MKKIPSFEVNHEKLKEVIYVSRKDKVGENTVTTFDLRFTIPNKEPAMDTAAVHATEHLAATFLRNDKKWAEKIIYFGPMGCRTGFYLIVSGDLYTKDIFELVKRCVEFCIGYEGNIPDSSARDCGNYLDLNLEFAKFYCRKYYDKVLSEYSEDRTVYPE